MTKTFKPTQDFETEERPPIALKPVESSKIAAVGHDAETNTLAVQFKYGAGAIYHYPDFSAAQHADFIASESIGKYFGANIQTLPFKKYKAEPAAA